MVEKSEEIFEFTPNAYFMLKSGTMITIEHPTPLSYGLGGVNKLPSPQPADAIKPGATVPIPLPYSSLGRPWSFWGDSNTFPDDVLKDLSTSTVGKAALGRRADIHYGKGIIYYKKTVVDKKIVKERVILPQIEAFFKEIDVQTLQPKIIMDLEFYWNAWPGFILSKDRSQIVSMYHNEARFTRNATMNPNTQRIENIYISSIWPVPWNPYLIILPTYNPLGMPKNCFNFVKQLKYVSPGAIYYSEAFWNSVRNNGWMKYVNQIPTLKNAILNNQFLIKYHVKIPFSYWELKYPKDKYPDSAERDGLKAKEMKQMNDFLSGAPNAGKTFISHFGQDEDGKPYPGWEIIAIDDKLKDGNYLPDSAAGDSQVLFAMMIYPALIGAGLEPAKMGAGSGANIREAFWLHIATADAQRHASLEPYRIVQKYNKWPDDIEFDYEDIDTSQTTDKTGQNTTNMSQDKKAPTIPNNQK